MLQSISIGIGECFQDKIHKKNPFIARVHIFIKVGSAKASLWKRKYQLRWHREPTNHLQRAKYCSTQINYSQETNIKHKISYQHIIVLQYLITKEMKFRRPTYYKDRGYGILCYNQHFLSIMLIWVKISCSRKAHVHSQQLLNLFHPGTHQLLHLIYM